MMKGNQRVRGMFPLGVGVGVILTFLSWGTKAMADHSLKNAMDDNVTIAQAVAQIQSVHQVVCDVANSNQTYYYRHETGRLGTAWKQITLCYEDEASLLRGQQYFSQGGTLGFYGAPGIVGVLVVSYTWENYQAKRLIAIEYL